MIGPIDPAEAGTDGTRDTEPLGRDGADTPPEQSRAVEEQPRGPRAGRGLHQPRPAPRRPALRGSAPGLRRAGRSCGTTGTRRRGRRGTSAMSVRLRRPRVRTGPSRVVHDLLPREPQDEPPATRRCCTARRPGRRGPVAVPSKRVGLEDDPEFRVDEVRATEEVRVVDRHLWSQCSPAVSSRRVTQGGLEGVGSPAVAAPRPRRTLAAPAPRIPGHEAAATGATTVPQGRVRDRQAPPRGASKRRQSTMVRSFDGAAVDHLCAGQAPRTTAPFRRAGRVGGA